MDVGQPSPACDLIVIMTTVASQSEAETLSQTLLRENLAACVSIHSPQQSSYWWQGQLCVEEEVGLTIKTLAAQQSVILDRIRSLHSYTTPELIILTPSYVSPDYLEWARSVLTPGLTQCQGSN